MPRSDRLATAAALLAVVAARPATVAAPAPPPMCRELHVSPAYRSDRTLVCTHRNAEGAFVLAVSKDAGRTWRDPAAVGLVRPPGLAGIVMTVTLSPAFGTDRALFATTGSGTFVSKDLGESFTPVDALTNGNVEDNPVAFVGTPAQLPGLPPAAPRVLLAYAASPTAAALIDPASGTRRPVAGVPGLGALRFVVPASPAAPAGAVAIVNDRYVAGPDAGRTRVFRCDANLACAEPLFVFPEGERFGPDSWLTRHPDGSLVALMSSTQRPGVRGWRSTDGGATFAVWEPVMRLVNGALTEGMTAPKVELATTPAARRTVYLRITTPMPRSRWSATMPPKNQVFRSDDAGATWRRVGYSRASGHPGPRGNLPWDATDGGGIHLTPDGRLLADGARESLQTTWCSLDGGRRWYAGCPR